MKPSQTPPAAPRPTSRPESRRTPGPSWWQKSLAISRPRFWLYLAGPYFLGVAAGADHPAVFWSPLFLVVLGYLLLPANVFLYGINDRYDADTDQFNPKKTDKEYRYQSADAGLIRRWVRLHLLLTLLILGLLPLGWLSVFIILLLVLSWSYSAPPLRWKARPWADSLSNCLYLLPGLIGYWLVAAALPPWPVVLGGVAWTTAMHLFSAIPDIAADQRAGLRTTAVALGRAASLWLCTGLWLLTALLVAGSLGQWWLWALLIYPCVPLLVLGRVAELDRVYWWFPWLNAGLGGLVFAILFGGQW